MSSVTGMLMVVETVKWNPWDEVEDESVAMGQNEEERADAGSKTRCSVPNPNPGHASISHSSLLSSSRPQTLPTFPSSLHHHPQCSR